MKKILRHEEGTSILEFALILPVFLALVLGVFDFGNGFNTYIGLANASREGAVWIAKYPTDRAGMSVRINEEVERTGLSSGEVIVTLDPDKPSYEAGEAVTISLHHNYPMMFGAFTKFATIDLYTETTMLVLYPLE